MHRLGTNNLDHYHSYHATCNIRKTKIIQYINRKLLQRLAGYLTTLSAPSTVSREMTKADKPEWIWKQAIVA